MNLMHSFEMPLGRETVKPWPAESRQTQPSVEREPAEKTPPRDAYADRSTIDTANVRLPSVEVPDDTGNWFDAYAEALDYLHAEDDPTRQLAAVGRINVHAPGYAKKWAALAPEQTLREIVRQATKEACDVGQTCTATLKEGRRDHDLTARIKNQLAKHSDILRFVENTNVDQAYKPAYEYLRSAAQVAGIAA